MEMARARVFTGWTSVRLAATPIWQNGVLCCYFAAGVTHVGFCFTTFLFLWTN